MNVYMLITNVCNTIRTRKQNLVRKDNDVLHKLTCIKSIQHIAKDNNLQVHKDHNLSLR